MFEIYILPGYTKNKEKVEINHRVVVHRLLTSMTNSVSPFSSLLLFLISLQTFNQALEFESTENHITIT